MLGIAYKANNPDGGQAGRIDTGHGFYQKNKH